MKHNKKAFTLIELLAVIVVLAILSLIAVPMVLKTIKGARENSYKRSIETYGRAVEYSVTEYYMSNPNKKIKSISFDNDKLFINGDFVTVEYNGNKVSCNDIEYIDSKIQLKCCSIMNSDSNNNYYDYIDGVLKQNSSNLCNAKSLYETVKGQSLGKDTDNNIDYSKASSDTNGLGVYELSETKDDSYPVYFYRGDVKNNNVLFDDFCWKIVRTTSTGGTKLIYNGTINKSGTCDNTKTASVLSGRTAFNSNKNSLAYIGYMYGDVYPLDQKEITQGLVFGSDITYSNGVYTLKDTITVDDDTVLKSYLFNYKYTCMSENTTCETVYYVYRTVWNSTIYYMSLSGVDTLENALKNMNKNKVNSVIKTKVDNWYESNIKGKADDYIEDTTYCNDRRKYKSQTSVYGEYAAYYRFTLSHERPSLDCDYNDKFTVNNITGNGALTYPIGLITADEITLAGGNKSNKKYYLYIGDGFFTMTPELVYYTGLLNYVEYGDSPVSLPGYVSNSWYARPVISISNNVLVTDGNGTVENPYKIILE